MAEKIFDTGMFCCAHISENDKRDIKKFTVHDSEGKGLVAYLQRFAFQDEETGDMRTYIRLVH